MTRRALTLMALCTLGSAPGGALNAGALHAQQRVDIRRAATPTISVRVSGAFAQMRVIAWSHDSIALTGTLPKGARLDGGVATGGVAPGAKFWIEASPTEPGAGTLELRVPAKARVWIKANTAAVEGEGLLGSVDFNIVAGSITLRGAPSEANLESMDGSVTVDANPAWMRIKTADGAVRIRGNTTDLGVTTVSGHVALSDGKHERARLESVTGQLSFGAELVRSGVLTMDSHSGAIELLATRKTALNVDARSLTGRVDNQLTPKRSSPGRDGRGEELTLELGTGDAQATIRSFKGSVSIVAR